MEGTVVGVLRGGPSREHQASLQTGALMLEHLSPDRFVSRDLYIDTGGQWYERGRIVDPMRVLHSIDVALVALHGEYGEDGQIQKLLDRAGVPYAGTDAFNSYMAIHRVFAKERAKQAGLQTPPYHFWEEGQEVEPFAHQVVKSFMQPVVIKPVRWGSSAVSIVGGFAPVAATLKSYVDRSSGGVVIEELIRGQEASVGLIENFRNDELYALPVVEARSDTAHFSRVATEDLISAAKLMHTTLGLRHYSRSDFIVAPRGIFYLKTTTLPRLTNKSLFTRSLESVGITLRDFLTHIVDLALGR